MQQERSERELAGLDQLCCGVERKVRRMRLLSVRSKRQIMSLAVVVPFIVFYLPLEDESWSLYVALCVSYTILVFGLLWSDGKWRKRFSRSWLPDWMFDGIDHELNYFLVFSGLGIVAIWWVEHSWLAKPPKKDERLGV